MEQNFIDEYDEIMNTLERLYKDTTDEVLQEEISAMIENFRLNCDTLKEEYEEKLMQEKNREIQALKEEYDRERL